MTRIPNDTFLYIMEQLTADGWDVNLNDRSNWNGDSEFIARKGDEQAENYVFQMHQSCSMYFRHNLQKFPIEVDLNSPEFRSVMGVLTKTGVFT